MNWLLGHLLGDYLFQNDYMAANKKQSTPICLLHVTIYSLCVWLMTGWSPAAMAVVFVTHFLQDRTQFIHHWMTFMGQSNFRDGICKPWSGIAIDQVWHFVVLYWICLQPWA